MLVLETGTQEYICEGITDVDCEPRFDAVCLFVEQLLDMATSDRTPSSRDGLAFCIRALVGENEQKEREGERLT